MNERVKYLRKSILKLSQLEFGKKISVSDTTISKVENGTSILTERNIKMICREFNVNYAWLVYGEGEIFNTIEKTLIDRLADEYNLSEEKRKLVERILALSDEEINNFTLSFFGFEFIKKDHQE